MSDFVSSALGAATGVSIGEAFIKIRADGSSFASEAGSKIKEVLSNPIVAGGAAVTALGVAVEQVATRSVDKFETLAGTVKGLQRVTGGSAEDMSRLKFAADETGVSADSLATGFKILSRNIEANSKGVKDSGIAFRDAHGNILPMNETLGKVADKFAAMPDGVAKNALAMQLFGRSGTDLIPVLDQGAAGLDALAKKSDAYGLTLSQKNVDDVRKYTLAQKDLHAAFSGLEVQLGIHLLPVFTKIIDSLNHFLIPVFEKVGKVLSEKLGPFFKDVSHQVDVLWSAFADPNNQGHNFADWLSNTLSKAIDDLQTAIDKAVPYIYAFFTGLFGQSSTTKFSDGTLNGMADFGEAVRKIANAVKDFVNFWEAHPTAFKDVAAGILGVWAAWNVVTTTSKVIHIAVDGVNDAINAITSVTNALSGIKDKVVNIGTKTAESAASGAAQGAGQNAGQSVGSQTAGNVISGFAGAIGERFLKPIEEAAGRLLSVFKGAILKTAAKLGIGPALAGVISGEIDIPVWGWIAAAVTIVGALAYTFRHELARFFKKVPGWLEDGAHDLEKNVPKLLEHVGKLLIEGLQRGAETGSKALLKFIGRIPDMIVFALGFAVGLLIRIGAAIIGGLYEGVRAVWNAEFKFWTKLPGVIANLIGDVASTLYSKGSDLISGLWNGIQDIWRTVSHFFEHLGRTVWDLIGDVSSWLYDRGRDLISGLWRGIQDFWRDPLGFFQRLPKNVWDAIGDVAGWLYSKGSDLISGIAHGIWDFWNKTLWPWISGFPGYVIHAFDGAATWLLQAGYDILKGLADGVANFLKGVGGSISSWAGRLGSDFVSGFKAGIGSHSPSVKMHAEGINIMQGLANGIESSRHVVQKVIDSVTGDILGLAPNSKITPMGSGILVKNYNLAVNSNYQSASDPVRWFQRMERQAMPL